MRTRSRGPRPEASDGPAQQRCFSTRLTSFSRAPDNVKYTRSTSEKPPLFRLSRTVFRAGGELLENPFRPPGKVKELHEKRAAPNGAGLFGRHAAGLARLPRGRIIWSQGGGLFGSMSQGFASPIWAGACGPKVPNYSVRCRRICASATGQERVAPKYRISRVPCRRICASATGQERVAPRCRISRVPMP